MRTPSLHSALVIALCASILPAVGIASAAGAGQTGKVDAEDAAIRPADPVVEFVAAEVHAVAQRRGQIEFDAPEAVAEQIDGPARLVVAELGIDLPLVDARPPSPEAAVQGLIDGCHGAIMYGRIGGLDLIGAHRTACGANGFGGVEALGQGSVVEIDGVRLEWVATDEGHAGRSLEAAAADWPDVHGVVLQTSLGGGRVRFQIFGTA